MRKIKPEAAKGVSERQSGQRLDESRVYELVLSERAKGLPITTLILLRQL